jgi:hypothetical protein
MLRKSLTLLVGLTLFAAGCQATGITTSSQSANPVQSSPALTENPHETSTPEAGSYSWRVTSLTLSIDLPNSPNQANVYLGKPDNPATIETARALAAQFGMQGQIYGGPDSFLIVDGNRRLQVQSDNQFSYYPNHFNYAISDVANAHPENADELIANFMQQYGFDADYTIKPSGYYAGYLVEPLTPDGFPLTFANFAASGLWFDFDKEGIVSVRANLLNYDPLGTFSIISAEEALQKLLAPDPKYGTLENFHSQTDSIPAWERAYPYDQTVTIYGYLDSIPSAENGDPLVSLDGYSVKGNTAGIQAGMSGAFVQATGKFHTEDGTDYFVLDSWQPHADQEGWLGTLKQQGDGVVLVTGDHGTLVMPDVPADVPLPLENVYALGVTVGDTYEWSFFDLRMANGSGGGGGGGGLGFYDVNLTGTPIPIPTLSSPNPNVGEHLDGQRGFSNVTLYNQTDGSQRAEYTMSYLREGQPFPTIVLLQGVGLDALQANQSRPLDIWGTVSGTNAYGMAIVDVDRFEIPFPNLQFQILQGKQQTIQVNGQTGILFTTDDGKSYLQLMLGGGLDGNMLIGNTGDEILLEALIVPDETFAGYATVHGFSASMATSPKNGQPMSLQITADRPYIMDEPQLQVQATPQPPAATIDTVELVYLAPYQVYDLPDSDFYIQPMWRFSGHYDTGEEFEVLVQALKLEFLSPVIVTVEGPG